MKKNIRLTIEYDGSRYAGWQRQKNEATVQQTLEDTLERLTGKKVELIGSGRTDSGVHARGQVANFLTDSRIPPERFSYALNTLLPRDIRIICSEEADMSFHSRFSALAKRYRYSIVNNPSGTAIGWQYFYHVPMLLDAQAMEEAVQYFKGTYDFAAFMAAGSPVKSTVRTIYDAALVKDAPFYHILLTGNGFLYNMVRIIAGTVIDAGKGKIKPDLIPQIIASGDRKQAGPTAPPHGLSLEEVYYQTIPEDALQQAVKLDISRK